MNVKVSLKTFLPAPKAKIDKAVNKALFATSEQMLTDMNFFVKEQEGTLRDSAQTEIDNTTLSVSWNTPYARKQYYTGRPSKNKNPNASKFWAAKAAAKYAKTTWREQLEKGIKDNL